MQLSIERAAEADAEAIVAVQIAAFHDDVRLHPGVEPGGPPGYDSVEWVRSRISSAEFFKIVLDGRIVGNLVVDIKEDGHYHLDVICVDPDFHNRGIGTRAMEFLDRMYPAARLWTLDTPVYATRNQHFYEKLGYVRGQPFDVDGFALYPYERSRK